MNMYEPSFGYSMDLVSLVVVSCPATILLAAGQLAAGVSLWLRLADLRGEFVLGEFWDPAEVRQRFHWNSMVPGLVNIQKTMENHHFHHF
jgi:hypothetical protein